MHLAIRKTVFTYYKSFLQYMNIVGILFVEVDVASILEKYLNKKEWTILKLTFILV